VLTKCSTNEHQYLIRNFPVLCTPRTTLAQIFQIDDAALPLSTFFLPVRGSTVAALPCRVLDPVSVKDGAVAAGAERGLCDRFVTELDKFFPETECGIPIFCFCLIVGFLP
jgi:hypothetical protein